jgi:hypothetical protein
MDTFRSFRFVATAIAAVMVLLLCGCGSDSSKDMGKARSRPAKVRAVESSLNQLTNTLEQLKVEQARQKELIATAEAEVAALRTALKAIRTRVSVPKKVPSPTADETGEEKEPGRSAIGQLLLLAFVVFLVVFGTHLYRQRDRCEEEEEAEQPAWEPPPPAPPEDKPAASSEADSPAASEEPADKSGQDTSPDN